MSNDDTVYLGRGHDVQKYHTDPECPYLPDDPADYREAERSAVTPGYEWCQVCQRPRGNVSSGCGPSAHYNALRRASADDVPPKGDP